MRFCSDLFHHQSGVRIYGDRAASGNRYQADVLFGRAKRGSGPAIAGLGPRLLEQTRTGRGG